MANEEQLSILKQGVTVWNMWREQHPDAEVDLSKTDLSNNNLIEAFAGLRFPAFYRANLGGASLHKANLKETRFHKADLVGADLSEADLTGADLSEAYLKGADFRGANLTRAHLREADLRGANLTRAHLSEADLKGANLSTAHLIGANLSKADLKDADLMSADLVSADLEGADLSKTHLRKADLRGANLTGSNLSGAILVGAKIDKAKVSGSLVYGISVWDLDGEFGEQRDLIITPFGSPMITTDNMKIAQFIFLILHQEEIRDVVNTFTAQSVLILGRFALPERKAILDVLRNELRGYNLLPIVFDFDHPMDKNFAETIRVLAGISYFVIADVTSPKSSPLELWTTVPDYQVPCVPILQNGEQPFVVMADLQKKYNWVLDTISYDSIEALIEALKPAIIDPAIKKYNELKLLKAREPKIRSAKDLLEK